MSKPFAVTYSVYIVAIIMCVCGCDGVCFDMVTGAWIWIWWNLILLFSKSHLLVTQVAMCVLLTETCGIEQRYVTSSLVINQSYLFCWLTKHINT